MPSSKGKRATRTRLQDHPPPSPMVSSPLAHGMKLSNDHVEDIESSLAAASFPAFIADSAFCGHVMDVSSSREHDGSGANLWLAEKAMVSASLRPGSLVSVTLFSIICIESWIFFVVVINFLSCFFITRCRLRLHLSFSRRNFLLIRWLTVVRRTLGYF